MTNKFVEGRACDKGLYFIPGCACSLYIKRGDNGIYDSGKKEIKETYRIGQELFEIPSDKDLLIAYVARKGKICDCRGDVTGIRIDDIDGNRFSLYDEKGNLFATGDFQGFMKRAGGEEFHCATLGHIANKAKKVMRVEVSHSVQ